MRGAHVVIGWAIVGSFLLLWVWGIVARLVRRDPGQWFWRLIAAVQVVIGIQAIVGIVLLAMGFRQSLLHYGYGAVFPVIVLVGAHVVARHGEVEPSVAFAWASFIAFGLTLRALATGLGIG